MSQQDLLTESDIDTLINLLLRSQQSRTREALCFSIGIEPTRLSFLRDSSDSDFFLLLIRYLSEIGDQEALCKLCHKELVPIFHNGTYSLFLSELAGKLNCGLEFRQNYPDNQQSTSSSSSFAPSVNVNLFNQLIKSKLVIGSAIFIIGLVGFSLYNHFTVQPVNQTLSRTANKNRIVNQQIINIYQKVLQREPTDSERKYYVDSLEKGQSLKSIGDELIKTSSILQDKSVISLECLGETPTNLKWLDSRIKNNNVSLTSDNIDAHTKWRVHVLDIDNGVIALENLGAINSSKWLDGVVSNQSVNLAPSIEGQYTGTKWKINIIGNEIVALDNQGESRWLNGVKENGSVNFAPHIGGNKYTGTRWKISKQ